MKKGISLVELLVAFLVSSILFILILKVFDAFVSTVFLFVRETKDSVAIFRAVDVLERDLNLSVGGFSCGTDFLSFNIVSEGSLKRVRYYITGKKVMRRSGNSHNTVMEIREEASFFDEGESVRFTIDRRDVLLRLGW